MGPPTYDYSPINMTTAPYYDYSSEKKDAAEVVRLATPTLRDAVENPMYLVMPTTLTQTYSFNWLYEKIDFLWGYSKTTGYTHKTIYDPCPYGYRVSGGELADLFTYASASPGEIVNGTYGQEVRVPAESSNPSVKQSYFFPYSGYKGVDRGLNSLISSWKYVGKKGDYQSSIVSMYTNDGDYYMHRSRIYLSKDRAWSELNVGDYTGHQIQDHTNRRTAAPVRCVKNEDHKRLMAFLTPDKYTIASKNDTINFTLYAYAFGSHIASATLSIGYHLKNNPEMHHEYEVTSWNNSSIGSTSIWNQVYSYNFSSIKDKSGNPLNIDETTGEFRFILTVKSSDNINKMSSTTIRLEKTNIQYLNWEDVETFFAGTDIDKRFRIYGDAEIKEVHIMNESDKSLQTATIQASSGSDYPYDYTCSTKGLKFNDAGTYKVYLKVVLQNNQELRFGPKTFEIKKSEWIEITSLNQINDTDEYLIMNVTSGGYAYDNGEYPYTKAESGSECYFKFKQSGNSYMIKNVPGNYANTSTYTLKMSADEGSAAKFTLAYTAEDGGYFTISIKVRVSQYYWQQIQGSNQITLSSYRNELPEIMRWKIYKKASSN